MAGAAEAQLSRTNPKSFLYCLLNSIHPRDGMQKEDCSQQQAESPTEEDMLSVESETTL